ncbi:hypothetical protein ISP17_06120 [Dyella ginsengisoli]|uniref:Uncharacterized protein n=1 Tax=Dyella ginsengisoli TaxID=363848 RepID=A0ABW8JQX8_9GAMM
MRLAFDGTDGSGIKRTVHDHECGRYVIGVAKASDEPAEAGVAAASRVARRRKYRAIRPIARPIDHPRSGRARNDEASGATHRGSRLAIPKHTSGPLLSMV